MTLNDYKQICICKYFNKRRFFGAALGCMDFKAAIMVIGLIILDMVLYYPLFKLLEKQKLEEENSVQAN